MIPRHLLLFTLLISLKHGLEKSVSAVALVFAFFGDASRQTLMNRHAIFFVISLGGVLKFETLVSLHLLTEGLLLLAVLLDSLAVSISDLYGGPGVLLNDDPPPLLLSLLSLPPQMLLMHFLNIVLLDVNQQRIGLIVVLSTFADTNRYLFVGFHDFCKYNIKYIQ